MGVPTIEFKFSFLKKMCDVRRCKKFFYEKTKCVVAKIPNVTKVSRKGKFLKKRNVWLRKGETIRGMYYSPQYII